MLFMPLIRFKKNKLFFLCLSCKPKLIRFIRYMLSQLRVLLFFYVPELLKCSEQ